ncbi:MAG: cytochrome c1 [Gammaproteobacteria bacterium]|nr:cytochrome c1 [Gammaproteobacteria bacterium]MDE2347061.1 cytochrome c1 [Gammaproteobacteria bacterium]
MLKRLLLITAFILPGGAAMAQDAGFPLQHADTNINDIQSLQRGARDFMNYCSGCHSLQYLRYNRVAKDLRIPPATMASDLMFTSHKPFDHIVSAMPAADAVTWFGKQPPDLTLESRYQSVDFIYSFLKGFYADKTRVWGVNNLYFPNVGMPFVLAPLAGVQKPVYKSVTDSSGQAHLELIGVAPMSPGSMTPAQYDRFVRDIANFLDYTAEPIKAQRESMGIFVTLFLLVFFAFAYLLKKEYWKDVH